MNPTRSNIGLPEHLTSVSKLWKSCGKSSMATIHLPPDFKEFLKLLNEYQVEYLLIGGYAVGYHGYPRATADMDIWIAIHSQNAIKIVAVLKTFGFDVPELKEELFVREDQIIRMGLPPVRLEIVTTISGVSYEHTPSSSLDA
jgi:hypothetical protein